MSQKKPLKSFAHKKASEQPTFKPKITNQTSEILAAQRRSKYNQSSEQVDIVSILTNPHYTFASQAKLEDIQRQKEEDELKELTLKPQTLSHKNKKLLADKRNSGDTNLNLYSNSKVHLKQNKTSE